jgi:hypothetical protein
MSQLSKFRQKVYIGKSKYNLLRNLIKVGYII